MTKNIQLQRLAARQRLPDSIHQNALSSSSSSSSSSTTFPDTIFSETLSAALGGAFSSACLFPLEVIKTRMQADDNTACFDCDKDNDDGDDDDDDDDDDGEAGTAYKARKKRSATSMIPFCRNLYRTGGGSIFYEGWEVSALQSAIEKASYFFAYTALKSLYRTATIKSRRSSSSSSSSQHLPMVATLVLGCLAEWAHLPITLPIDALTTAIQTKNKNSPRDGQSDSRMTKKKEHAMALLLTLWKNKSLYKGIQAYLVLCFKPAIQYTVFEQIKSLMLKARQQRPQHNHRSLIPPLLTTLSAVEAFVLGMLARTVATLAVFPFQRAKVRMQSSVTTSGKSLAAGDTATSATSLEPEHDQNNESMDYSGIATNLPATSTLTSGNIQRSTSTTISIWQMLVDTYTNEGIGGLYQGLGPELTRGVLSAALMMMVKERISGGVKTVLYGKNDQ